MFCHVISFAEAKAGRRESGTAGIKNLIVFRIDSLFVGKTHPPGLTMHVGHQFLETVISGVMVMPLVEVFVNLFGCAESFSSLWALLCCLIPGSGSAPSPFMYRRPKRVISSLFIQ